MNTHFFPISIKDITFLFARKRNYGVFTHFLSFLFLHKIRVLSSLISIPSANNLVQISIISYFVFNGFLTSPPSFTIFFLMFFQLLLQPNIRVFFVKKNSIFSLEIFQSLLIAVRIIFKIASLM